jgi:hypothetical protein
VLICDGGTIPWGEETYTERDPLFGVLKGFDPIQEGVGDAAPAFMVSFFPDPAAAAAGLTNPAFQNRRMRAWTAEIDPDLGTVTGEPELEIEAIVNVPRLRFPSGGRVLEVDFVSVWQKLLDRNKGNLLNGSSHELIHPGEYGLRNTTGVAMNVPWGTSGVRGVVTASAAGVGGGSGGGGGVRGSQASD